jgi:5-methylcytosine-specific restriction endonuclease McrA
MENNIIKVCKIHGETEFAYRSDNRHRCKKCNTDAVIKRRKKIKIDAIRYKGGSCQKCGYDKCVSALEFHHLDPNEKDFNISKSGHSRSWERVKNELDKCVLLCSNCHKETHEELEKTSS